MRMITRGIDLDEDSFQLWRSNMTVTIFRGGGMISDQWWNFRILVEGSAMELSDFSVRT